MKPRKGKVEDARQAAMDEGRARKALLCLHNLISAARSQTDIATWINEGGLDLEDFVSALISGGNHPLFDWHSRRRPPSRPPPNMRERHIQRLAYLACVALVRAKAHKGAARTMMAKALVKIIPGITADTLRYWERDQPPLTAQDEEVLDNALDRIGHDHERLVGHFVGFIDVRTNPYVKLLR